MAAILRCVSKASNRRVGPIVFTCMCVCVCVCMYIGVLGGGGVNYLGACNKFTYTFCTCTSETSWQKKIHFNIVYQHNININKKNNKKYVTRVFFLSVNTSHIYEYQSVPDPG